jgi:hypothetical protein
MRCTACLLNCGTSPKPCCATLCESDHCAAYIEADMAGFRGRYRLKSSSAKTPGSTAKLDQLFPLLPALDEQQDRPALSGSSCGFVGGVCCKLLTKILTRIINTEFSPYLREAPSVHDGHRVSWSGCRHGQLFAAQLQECRHFPENL